MKEGKGGKVLSFEDAKNRAEREKRLEELRVRYADVSQKMGNLTLEIARLSISGKDKDRRRLLVVERENLQTGAKAILEEVERMGIDKAEFVLSIKD